MTPRWAAIAAALAVTGACKKEEPRPQVTAEPPAVASVAAEPPASATATASVVPAPPVVASATASAVASARRPAGVPCGSKTCAPSQYCLHYDPGSGGAYSPDKKHGDAAFCSETVSHTGSLSCGPPDRAHQAWCQAFIPSAPPHGPDLAPP